ncbi:hypothetical protein J3E07_000582 [Methanococcus voltae]|uniref:Uncharacterized protein n=2 Tax=Methanococcus voltae TaxID=2188 RepID=A0A8J7RN02_METVO|nr:hypothetical protein [Methanococcus voltae]MBP2201184.1 hypothetical protein [Methanococcus voltae]MCS3921907.1 hypothetical protein [Methanococcus voltae PS]
MAKGKKSNDKGANAPKKENTQKGKSSNKSAGKGKK